jgi:serine/threonine protein kinase
VYTENEARDLFVTLVSTIQYIHSKGVVHRDLKVQGCTASTPSTINGTHVHIFVITLFLTIVCFVVQLDNLLLAGACDVTIKVGQWAAWYTKRP